MALNIYSFCLVGNSQGNFIVYPHIPLKSQIYRIDFLPINYIIYVRIFLKEVLKWHVCAYWF